MNLKKIFARKVRPTGEPLTIKELDQMIKNRMKIADKEFSSGYDLIKKYPRSVSILGSARFKPDHPYYKQAESLGRRIAKELNYAVGYQASNKNLLLEKFRKVSFKIDESLKIRDYYVNFY